MDKNKKLVLFLYVSIGLVLTIFLVFQYFQYRNNISSLKKQTDISIKAELTKLYKDFKRDVSNISLAIELGIESFYKYTHSNIALAKGLNEIRKIVGLREIFFINSENKILLPSKATYEIGVIPPQWVDIELFSNTGAFLKEIERAKKVRNITYNVIFLSHFNRKVFLWERKPFLLIITPIFEKDRYLGCGIALLDLKSFFKKCFHKRIWIDKYGNFLFAILDSKNRFFYVSKKGNEFDIKKRVGLNLKKNYKDYNFVYLSFPFYHTKNWTLIFGYQKAFLDNQVKSLFLKNLIYSLLVVFLVFFIFIIINLINRRHLSLILRYQQAIDHISNPFVFITLEGEITYTNQAFVEVFGLEKGKSIMDLFETQGEDSEISKKDIYEKIKTRTSFRGLQSLRTKSGELRYFKVMFSSVGIERDIFMAGDFSDVTEIIELEKRLRRYATELEKMVEERTKEIIEREREYRQIFENQLMGIAVLNTKGDLLFYNRTFKILSEYSEDELKRLNFKELCSPTDKDMIISLFDSCLNEGEVFQKEIKFFPKRKRTIFVDIFLQKTTYRGESAVLVFLTDVTRRKILENRLREQERVAILGEMAAGVAHDINNLFMAISGHMELAYNMIDKSKEIVKSHLESSISLIKEGESIVRRLYAYAQKQIRSSEIIDLNDLVKDTVMLIRPIWKNIVQKTGKEIRLREEYGKIKPIVGNSAEIKEVFVNLIKNAVEAMPEGGEVYIKTWMDSENVYVMVKDTGIGISEDIKYKIFDPFFSTKGEQGSGLGLAISLGIVKAYGGNIKVESKEGEGATFIVSFPIAPENVLRAEEKEERGAEFKIKDFKKVLIVEDEKEVLDVLKNLIELLGADVIGTTSPKEGIEIFKNQKDDIGLVISDLGMPEMSGFDLCKRLKEMNPSIKVILLTGWGLTIEEEKKKEFKIDEILSKPVTLETLKSVLYKYLSSL